MGSELLGEEICAHARREVLCQNRPKSGRDKHEHENYMEHPVIDELLVQRVSRQACPDQRRRDAKFAKARSA
jgi:hypothetical protein